LEARLEEQAQCILVIIGATPEGKKELVGFTDGMRESSQSWRRETREQNCGEPTYSRRFRGSLTSAL